MSLTLAATSSKTTSAASWAMWRHLVIRAGKGDVEAEDGEDDEDEKTDEGRPAA